MKTANEYASEYREIASNLGLQGDTVELMVQMLAHFTYTNEVDNITYTNEASLERCLQPNSKIQHCIERMYSVFRGRCPRVLIRFRPTKFFEFSLFDEVVVGNSFKLYYLGYLPSDSDETTTSTGILNSSLGNSGDLGFTYAPVTIGPSDSGYCTIICLLAKDYVEREFTLSSDNLYYVDITENDLSSDLWVKVSGINSGSLEYIDTTREFQEHLLNNYVFDLTLTGWGSRLYLPEDYRVANTQVTCGYYKYCSISDVNVYDLESIKIQGGELVAFTDTSMTEFIDGVIILSETDKENLSTVHYEANKNRYMGSILRSNSDVSNLLKEMYPKKVKDTSYEFSSIPDSVYSYSYRNIELQDSDKILCSSITTYTSSGDKNMDFTIYPNTDTKVIINVDTTNSVSPKTYSYSLKSESPITKNGQTNSIYVIKTYLDSDNVIKERVINFSEFSSEGLSCYYVYTNINDEDDTTLVTSNTIPAVSDVEVSGSLVITLYKNGVIEDTLTIPFLLDDTTYFGLIDKYYKVPMSSSLKPLIDFSENNLNITSLLILDGSVTTADSYSISSIPPEVTAEISSEGVLSITNFTGTVGDYNIVIQATISGLSYTSIFTLNTTSTESSYPRLLQLYRKYSTGEYTLLKEYESYPDTSIEIDNITSIIGNSSTTDTEVTLGLNCRSINNDYSEINISGISVESSKETEESLVSRSEYVPELDIYYIPQNNSDLLSEEEKTDFINTRSSYYITNNMNILRGNLISISLDISVLLYQNESIEDDVEDILDKYQDKFGIDIDTLLDDISSQIGKISNVSRVKFINPTFKEESGDTIDIDSYDKLSDIINTSTTYFTLTSFISSDLV